MRVLLDQECTAVAGGHESACEEAMTGVIAAAGATVGAIVGSGAGGVGAVPGGIAGFTAGATIGGVVDGPACRMAEKLPGKPPGPELKYWFRHQYLDWHQSRVYREDCLPKIYAPHEFVADGAKY